MLTGLTDGPRRLSRTFFATNTAPTGVSARRRPRQPPRSRGPSTSSRRDRIGPGRVRRKNFVPAFATYTTPTGTSTTSGATAMRSTGGCLPITGFARNKPARTRGPNHSASGYLRGSHGHGSPTRQEYGSVELSPRTCWPSPDRRRTAKATTRLWLLISDDSSSRWTDHVLHGDTDVVPWSNVTGGSRSPNPGSRLSTRSPASPQSTGQAADARSQADYVVLDRARSCFTSGTPQSRVLAEIADAIGNATRWCAQILA